MYSLSNPNFAKYPVFRSPGSPDISLGEGSYSAEHTSAKADRSTTSPGLSVGLLQCAPIISAPMFEVKCPVQVDLGAARLVWGHPIAVRRTAIPLAGVHHLIHQFQHGPTRLGTAKFGLAAVWRNARLLSAAISLGQPSGGIVPRPISHRGRLACQLPAIQKGTRADEARAAEK